MNKNFAFHDRIAIMLMLYKLLLFIEKMIYNKFFLSLVFEYNVVKKLYIVIIFSKNLGNKF